MHKFKFIFSGLLIAFHISAQNFNENRTSFSNFFKRMYTSAPFEGVKIVEDYERKYLVSVLSLDKAKYINPSVMNRVAQVKAQSQANTFLNGATITMDMVIKTTETKTKDSINTIIETIESIKQNSMGFTQGLELLTNFENYDGKRMVFVYMREMNTEKND